MDLNFETAGVNIESNKATEIATPKNICKDMSDLFDYTDCNKKIWMDLRCKTGNTLEALLNNGVSRNNIVAICDNKQSQMLVCRKLYGEILPEIEVTINQTSLKAYTVTRRGQIYWVSDWKNKVKEDKHNVNNLIKGVILKEMEKTMSLEFTAEDREFGIDNIIMNPPYNNDIYIDFVMLAKQIAKDSVVAITPAKWQAKGGKNNELFRRNIVPYISDIEVYIDCGDIFNIRLQGGVAYYLIGKDKNESTNIVNHCERVKAFESNGIEVRHLDESKCFINNTTLYNICNKVGCFSDEFKSWKFGDIPVKNNYNVFATAVNTDAGGKTSFHIFSSDGKLTMLAPFTISKDTFFRSNDTKCFFTSINKYEAESFISWANTKFIRFMLLMRYCTYHNNNEESWSFVPDPGDFDHIFTDKEFYEKYNLTEEEIAIIESVIKDKK